MKTPMQELIDMIERKSYLTKDDIIFEANKLLEKERQMVIDAFGAGFRDALKPNLQQVNSFVEYFELTYNPNQNG